MPNYSGIWTEQAVMQANGAGNWPNAPGAPTIGTATDTTNGGSVSVAFTAPTFAGLPAVITGYTVTSSPGGVTGTGASSPITVSGLTNGTAYTFTVTATNASGTSAASAASNSVTPTLVVYVEQTFSTYLYTGNSSTQTITNGIDLSGKGGLVWIKNRQTTIGVDIGHILTDTARGVTKFLRSQSTSAQETSASSITAFNSSGFSFGSDTNINYSGDTYASWTFREQAKFFDVVTYTGNATAGRTVAHNLGSVPGCIIIKKTTGVESWAVYHRSLGTAQALRLNLTNAASSPYWNGTSPTDTVFTVDNSGEVNDSGATYVAYLFAHDAGGFGLTGTDNVISCGSTTLVGSGVETVTLGYEPQWVLWKLASASGNWHIVDVMRGMSQTSAAFLNPNSSGAEGVASGAPYFTATSTGFSTESYFGAGDYIYITIRRGPMKVPTSGTSVFLPTTYTGNGSTQTITTNFPVDFSLFINRTKSNFANNNVFDRLRGGTRYLATNVTDAESSLGSGIAPLYDSNTGVNLQAATITNGNLASIIVENFRRAPSFFDEVCYTGTGANRTVTHNLAAVPELMIVKNRVQAGGENWTVYTTATTATKAMYLNSTSQAVTASVFWNNTDPTSTVFSVGTAGNVNTNTETYVAYLFATCAGVSKVGSYTGTATTQTIDCGFTAGSRFVLIKRTDSNGFDWYVWDSARGIIAGNDPYLLLNSTAAEVTNTDYVDTAATGFEISSTAPAAINANGGTFIFLAIA